MRNEKEMNEDAAGTFCALLKKERSEGKMTARKREDK